MADSCANLAHYWHNCVMNTPIDTVSEITLTVKDIQELETVIQAFAVLKKISN